MAEQESESALLAYKKARSARPLRTGVRDWVASRLGNFALRAASSEFRALTEEALAIGLRELASKNRTGGS